MALCYEWVCSEMPFRVRRRVRWSECDPAGVVYAGRFTDYLLDACSLFFSQIGFGHGDRDRGGEPLGLPAKHMSLTFATSLYPEQEFDIRVSVTAIRMRTFDLAIEATLMDGRTVFEGKLSPICIVPGVRRSIPIPDALRSALDSHRTGKRAAR